MPDAWCPRCDDLEPVGAGAPCAACATPRVVLAQPTRPAPPARVPAADVAPPPPAAAPPTSQAAPAAPGGRPGPGSRRRWWPALVAGLAVLGLAVGLASADRLTAAPPAAASAGQAATAGAAAQARDVLHGWQSRPDQVARPAAWLPSRGPMLPGGAGGAMIVEYAGWLWRQELAGGPPAATSRLPTLAGQLSLAPRTGQVALVSVERDRQRVEVRRLDGTLIDRMAGAASPAWSRDGTLAYLRGGVRRSTALRFSGPPRLELRLPSGRRDALGPVDPMLLGARLGWTGDGQVVLVRTDPPAAGLYTADRGRVRRLVPGGTGPLAGGRGAALTAGLPRAADALGPLGAAVAGRPPALVALSPDGRRVATVAAAGGRAWLRLLGPGARPAPAALPADRYLSLHWSPDGRLVWVAGARRVVAVGAVSGRVAGGGSGLPAGAHVLGFVA